MLRTENNSIKNRPGRRYTLDPLLPFPMELESFLSANSSRTKDFYKGGGEFRCPPRFDTDRPFIEVAMRFYEIVREFVGEMAPHIEVDLLDDLMKKAGEQIPAINDFDKLEVLATFIWQVSVLHSSDHFSYYKAYCHNATVHDDVTALKRKPVYPTVMTRSLRDSTPATTLNEVADRLYMHRARYYFAVFGRFNHNPALDLTMQNLSYTFAQSAANEAAARFQARLVELEKELIAENRLICPLQEMAQSICF